MTTTSYLAVNSVLANNIKIAGIDQKFKDEEGQGNGCYGRRFPLLLDSDFQFMLYLHGYW